MGYSNTKQIMGNRKRWEKVGGSKNSCRICGQMIENGEEFYLKITSPDWNGKEPNFLVHANEWDEQYGDFDDFDKALSILHEKEKPKTKNLLKPDIRKFQCFKEVLRERHLRITKENKNRIYFKADRNVAIFYYDARFDEIEFTGRANGLFDGFFLREFVGRLRNDLSVKLGENENSLVPAEKEVKNTL